MAKREKARLPFDGTKVVEFTFGAVAPLSALPLAAYGATVIKVESHTHLDGLRCFGVFKEGVPGVDRGGYWTNYNWSKRSLSLDVTKPLGRKTVMKLLAWTDVVIEGFTPGTMARLGLDYENIRKVNPRVVYVSTSMHGQTGPEAGQPGLGPQGTAMAGITELCGWPDRVGTSPSLAYTDFICPPILGATLVAALDRQRRTGQGIYLDHSQQETGLHYIAPVIMDYVVNGRVAMRNGNKQPNAAPHNAYQCQGNDQWVAIAVFTDHEWKALCRAMGRPRWTKSPEFATLSARKANEDELNSLIGQWTARHTAEQAERMLQAAGVAAHMLESPAQLFEDPQLKHRNALMTVDHAVIGEHAHESLCFHLSGCEARALPAPCLGQDNEYVLKEVMNLSEDEIGDLYAESVVTTEADLLVGT